MVLRIITLVKQVPDTANIPDNAMKADGTVNRSALPAITNPEDLNALEEALKIKGLITAITLGPPSAIKVLKESLYRGADDAVLVTDAKFAASDTLATSYALTKAIEKIGKFDIILCGRQAIDGDTAQVGPQIAQKLGINQLTGVVEIISADKEHVKVKRIIDGGYEILKSPLPVLITVRGEANEPRGPSVKRAMLYKNITCKCNESYDEAYLHPEIGCSCENIKQWSAEDLKADLKMCGLSGSPTKVKNIENVVLAARNTRMIANTAEDIGALMQELTKEHIIG
ncbi:MAG: electron transfer flavoprotein subunit beta/FixA family protein [Gammaproteobacteria bacterium]|jgi:electron transfer flavoprotein beta subunit